MWKPLERLPHIMFKLLCFTLKTPIPSNRWEEHSLAQKNIKSLGRVFIGPEEHQVTGKNIHWRRRTSSRWKEHSLAQKNIKSLARTFIDPEEHQVHGKNIQLSQVSH